MLAAVPAGTPQSPGLGAAVSPDYVPIAPTAYGAGGAPSVTAGVIVDPILEATRSGQTSLSGTIPVSHGRRLVNGRTIWVDEITPDITSSGCNTHWLATFAIAFGYSAIPLVDRPHCLVTRLFANGKELTSLETLTFTLHDGTEDPPTPDATILESMGEDALSYPEMIYIVFKDFPLWKVQAENDTQVPEITVELSDHPGDDGAVELLGSIDPNPGADTQGTIVDWDDGLYYNFSGTATAKTLHVYDIESRDEVRTVDLDMAGQAADGFYTANSRAFLAYDKINKLAFCDGDITNTEPIVCFNVNSGKAVSVFGASSSDTDDSDTAFVKTYRGLCVRPSEGGLIYNALVCLSNFYDYGVLTYQNDGSGFEHVGHGTPPDTLGFSKISGDLLRCMVEYEFAPAGNQCTPGTQATKQDTYVLIGVGYKIYMLRIGVRVGVMQIVSFTHWFSLLHPNMLINGILVDKVDGSVVIFMNDVDAPATTSVAKIGVTINSIAGLGSAPLANQLIYNKSIPEYHPAFQQSAFAYSHPDGETWVYPSSGNYVFLNLSNATWTLSPDLTVNYTPATEDYWFNGRTIYLNTAVVPYPSGDEGAAVIEFTNSSGGFDSLHDIIEWYCQLGGMTSADYDVDSALTDLVYGGLLSEPHDLWGQLFPDMARVFNFITFMSGGVQKFRRIGSGPDATLRFRLTEDDLAAVDGAASGVFEGMHTVDPAPNELPGEASVGFINYDKDYTIDSSTFHRNTFPARTRVGRTAVSYNVPFVMSALDAQSRAMRLAYEPQATLRTSTLRLGRSFWLFEPGDSGTVVTAGQETQIRLQEMVFNGDWSVSVSCTDDQFSTVFGTGGVLPDGTGDPTHPPPPTVLDDPPDNPPTPDPDSANSDSGILLIDANLITADDDLPPDDSIVYVGATAKTSIWAGATVFINGVAIGHTATDVDVGFVNDVIPDEDRVWQSHDDYDIDVTLKVGATPLASVTDAQYRAGTNAALVGAAGRWELIFWRDVAQLSPSQWRLSHIARGRRGTNTHVGSHVAGEAFIPISGVFPGLQPEANIGTTITAKAVGDTVTVVPPETSITYAAVSKKPWSPAYPQAALGSTINAVGSTDYTNTCGGGSFGSPLGSREAVITVTASFTPNQGSLSNLIDSGQGNNSTDAIEIPNGLTTAIITFDFRPSGFKQIIDALTWLQSNSTTQGTYDIEASDDGASWSSLTTAVSLTSGSSLHETTWSNSTGYWFYRVKQVGGTTSNSPWVKEVYFRCMADVDADDIIVSWRRRDRRADDTWSDPDLPLSEATEEYELDIYSGSTVVRTVTDVTDNLYVYHAADQVTDGFTPPLASLKVSIYQISVLVGRGYPKEKTLDV